MPLERRKRPWRAKTEEERAGIFNGVGGGMGVVRVEFLRLRDSLPVT